MKKWNVCTWRRSYGTALEEGSSRVSDTIVEADGFFIDEGYLVFVNKGNVAAFAEWESVKLIGESCCGQDCDKS